MGRFIHILFSLLLAGTLAAQDLDLANEYFHKEEYDKAKHHYELAMKKHVPLKELYPNYPQTLKKLGDAEGADRFFKKIIKTDHVAYTYKLDYLEFLKESKSKDLPKMTDKYIKEALLEESSYPAQLYYLSGKGRYELLDKYIQAYRQVKHNRTAFYKELAEAKKAQGKTTEMADELLLGFLTDNELVDNLKNILQNYLTEPEELQHFQQLLLQKSQEDPENSTISELLIWLFVQQRDFEGAALHARALDKKLKTQGEKLKEIADLALENKSYDAAISMYQSIIKDYPKSPNFFYARGKLLTAKEQKIKSHYPINQAELNGLVSDYKVLIAEASKTGSTNAYKYQADMALLYGFYQGKLDSAIILVSNALKNSAFDKKFQALTRLNLGDLYLLDNQPWESSLLYSQVESLEKDQPLGHEAKLRNAKLYYYQGDFKLAQEQLDVLKLATSREISNDAIQLSVLIQDNMTEDTTGYALKRYANVELLIFQNKWDTAKKELEDLYLEYRAKSLKDDILMLEAKIAKQFGNYPEAVVKLTELLQNHSDDILADDAAYQIAQIYDYHLKDREKAMEYYNKVVTQFPASIFVVDARKKYREMRGDKVN